MESKFQSLSYHFSRHCERVNHLSQFNVRVVQLSRPFRVIILTDDLKVLEKKFFATILESFFSACGVLKYLARTCLINLAGKGIHVEMNSVLSLSNFFRLLRRTVEIFLIKTYVYVYKEREEKRMKAAKKESALVMQGDKRSRTNGGIMELEK